MMIKNKFKLLCLLPLSLAAVTTPIILSSCSTSVVDSNTQSGNDTTIKRLEEVKYESGINPFDKNIELIQKELIYPQIKNIYLKEKIIKDNVSGETISDYEITEAFKTMIQDGVLSQLYKVYNDASSNISLSIGDKTSIRVFDNRDAISIDYLKENNEDCFLYITPKLITKNEIMVIKTKIEEKKDDPSINYLYNEFISSGIFDEIISMNQNNGKYGVGLFGFNFSITKPYDEETNHTLFQSFMPLKKANNKTYMYSSYYSANK